MDKKITSWKRKTTTPKEKTRKMNVDRRAAQETILKMKSWVTPKKIAMSHEPTDVLAFGSQDKAPEKSRIFLSLAVTIKMDTKDNCQRTVNH